MKTSPDTHIAHVRDSGVRKAIKLAKVWRDRFGIEAKTFVLELLVIKIVASQAGEPLDTQMRRLFEEFRDNAEDLTVSDPANSNNDLAPLVDEARDALQTGADHALDLVDTDRWEGVFGPLPEEDESPPSSGSIREIASSDSTRVRPWAG